jgi:hypothetical protein
MTIVEFLTVKIRILHTAKLVQHATWLDFTASCLYSTTVEMNGDASQSTMSLRNALQIEAVLADRIYSNMSYSLHGDPNSSGRT